MNNANEEKTIAYLLPAPIREWHVYLMDYCNLLMIYRTPYTSRLLSVYLLVLLGVYDHDDDDEGQYNNNLIINDKEKRCYSKTMPFVLLF